MMMAAPDEKPKYKLQDLIDIEQFQSLQDRLNEIYSFPSAIIDNDGNVLTATAWQEICTQFHRKHPLCAAECIKSDLYILKHLPEANPAISYRCPHGLVDNATPIIIDGVHYGNFFTGQFFLEAPDLDFFREQARRYGFDEEAYLSAVKKTPIWSKKQLENYLFFIKGLIEVISSSGLKKLKEIESHKKIVENEERAAVILSQTLDGFWLTKGGQIVDANRAMCDMLGYTRDEILSLSVADIEALDSPLEVEQRIQQIILDGSAHFESRFRRKNGSVIDVEVSVTHLSSINLMFGFHRDITDRKQAEERTQKALAEKEILLRELYHHTRNNMSVINALLGLQASYTRDERLQKAFEQAQGRIKSMALVHQKLYETKDLSLINLKDYIHDLTQLIAQSYMVLPNQVAFTLNLEDVFVLIDTAIPCGLILNELISNSLTHAFPDGKNGEIKVQLHRTGNGVIHLCIADNGVGMPPGYDVRREGRMGLQTVFSLAEMQLKASIHCDTESGVSYQLLFKDDLYKARV